MTVFELVGSLTLESAGFMAGLAKAASSLTRFVESSVKTGMTFDATMSQVAATMGTTADEIDDLREYALSMGATTAFSSSQVAQALNYMALAGYDAEQSMETLPSVLNLAAAGSMDLASASDMVTDAASALGLSMAETDALVDKMARTASRSNTSVAQLGSAMLTIGGTAKDLAGGTTELATSLGILADNGIKGSEGGTKLRNVLLSLEAPTDKASAVLEELGVSACDAEGNLRPLNETFADLNDALEGMSTQERVNAISDIFNKRDLDAVNALLGTSVERWDELTRSVDSAQYSIASLPASLDKYGGSLGLMMQNLNGLGVTANELTESLNNSNMQADAFAAALLAAADEGTTMQEVAEALGMSLADLQKAFDETKGAADEMAETQLDNYAGALTKLHSAWDNFKITISDIFTPIFRTIAEQATGAINRLNEAMSERGFIGFASQLGAEIHSLLKTVDFTGIFTTITEVIVPGFVSALQGIGNGILNVWPTIYEALINLFGKVTAHVGELLDGLWTTLQPRLAGWYNGSGFQSFIKSIPFVGEMINTALVNAFGPIPNVLEETFEGAQSALDKGILNLRNPKVDSEFTLLRDFDAIVRELNNIKKQSGDSSGEIQDLINKIKDLYSEGSEGEIILAVDEEEAAKVLEEVKAKLDELSAGTEVPIVPDVKDALDAIDGVQDALDSVQGKTVYVDVITQHIYDEQGVGGIGDTNKIGKEIAQNYAVNARSMFGGTILQGATMFGWDAQGRPQIGGGEGPEAVVGVNSLNQQIREAVRQGLSGVAGAIASAVSGASHPIYVVLDTGELVGAIGPKMDDELARYGDWKGGGRA